MRNDGGVLSGEKWPYRDLWGTVTLPPGRIGTENELVRKCDGVGRANERRR